MKGITRALAPSIIAFTMACGDADEPCSERFARAEDGNCLAIDDGHADDDDDSSPTTNDTDTDTTTSTSDVGDPVSTADIVGRTYAVDLQSGRFTRPNGIGPLIQQSLAGPVLLKVDALIGSDLRFMAAPSTTLPTQQDPCYPTVDFPVLAAFDDNPIFSTGPGTDLVMDAGATLRIEDPILTGAFAPDGSEIDGVILTGSIDTRALGGLIGAAGDPDAVCDMVVTFGEACTACLDGEAFCLDLTVDAMTTSPATAGVNLQGITPQQAAANCP